MKYRKRTFYTGEQMSLMWDRWQRGDSILEIASLFDRHHSSVRGIFERRGGIRPPTRRRSARSLTLAEREEIFRGLVAEQSLRSIALRLGRAPSTVSREVQRNGGRDGYSISAADEAAWDRALRPKDCKLVSLATDIKVYFCDPQSPWRRGSNEQINGLLRQYFPKGMDLSNVDQNHLDAIARRLNERPRKTLDYYSPAEKLAECVASIR